MARYKRLFEGYLESGDPEVRHKANAWQKAINNRIMAGESVPPWFIQLAEKHIRGEITLEEFDDLLATHWNEIDYILENGMPDPS